MNEETINVPKHLGLILDGNRRWAKERGLPTLEGHQQGAEALKTVSLAAFDRGIEYVSVYAFSTENWARPEFEVRALMELLVQSISNELPTMLKNNVKLDTIGDTDSLPRSCRNTLAEAIEATKDNTGLNLVLALGYSGKWDITQAARKIAEDVKNGVIAPEQINEEMLATKLATQSRPEVDLMLRTGGDHRISNFLLWQLAYAELYFYENLFWPDFRREHLYEAIAAFQNRERRFGKTGEQIKANSAK